MSAGLFLPAAAAAAAALPEERWVVLVCPCVPVLPWLVRFDIGCFLREGPCSVVHQEQSGSREYHPCLAGGNTSSSTCLAQLTSQCRHSNCNVLLHAGQQSTCWLETLHGTSGRPVGLGCRQSAVRPASGGEGAIPQPPNFTGLDCPSIVRFTPSGTHTYAFDLSRAHHGLGSHMGNSAASGAWSNAPPAPAEPEAATAVAAAVRASGSRAERTSVIVRRFQQLQPRCCSRCSTLALPQPAAPPRSLSPDKGRMACCVALRRTACLAPCGRPTPTAAAVAALAGKLGAGLCCCHVCLHQPTLYLSRD